MVLPQPMIALRWLRHGKAPLLTTSQEGVVLGGQGFWMEECFYLVPHRDLSTPDVPPLLITPDSLLMDMCTILIAVIVSQVYAYTKTYQIVHFKHVHFIVYQLLLNKVVKKSTRNVISTPYTE